MRLKTGFNRKFKKIAAFWYQIRLCYNNKKLSKSTFNILKKTYCTYYRRYFGRHKTLFSKQPWPRKNKRKKLVNFLGNSMENGWKKVSCFLISSCFKKSFFKATKGQRCVLLVEKTKGFFFTNAIFFFSRTFFFRWGRKYELFFVSSPVLPLYVHIPSERNSLSAERVYDLHCTTFGSRPSALVTWWLGSTQLLDHSNEVSVNYPRKTINLWSFFKEKPSSTLRARKSTWKML